MFDAKGQEKLRYYVYGLFHPDEPNWPFYIGKGSGNRVFSHAAGQLLEEEFSTDSLSAKAEVIADIKRCGKQVVQKIIRHDLSEKEALLVEAALIDLVNHIKPETLRNQVSGHGVAEGIIDAIDLATALRATPLQTEVRLLIVKIDRRWTKLVSKYEAEHDIPPADIFDAVRGDWKLSVSRANQAECVLAVARGLVRAAFVVDRWYDSGNEQRKRFDGRTAPDRCTDFIGQSVTGLFSRGGQNPIRYLNC